MRNVDLLTVLLVASCRFDLPIVRNTPDAAFDAPIIPADAPADAQLSGDSFRKQITIDAARVTGNHTAFPVWIALVDADLRTRATAYGDDIHFRHPNGARLPYQIQHWDRSTGRLEAWVRVDLDDAVNTVIELRYGVPGAAHEPDSWAVFSNSFLAVWHLDDSLGTAAVADSTVYRRTGTALGGLGTSDQVSARLGGGIDFDGNDDRISFMSPFSGIGNHTISAWVNQRTATDFDSIITMGDPVQGRSRWFNSHSATNTISVGFYGPDWQGPALPNIENAGWVLLHWVFNGATKQNRIYRDGIEVASHTLGAGMDNSQGTGGHLGYAPEAWGPGGNTPNALNGILDEIRISLAERSAGWIATEYANQNAPQTFYTVGPEDFAP